MQIRTADSAHLSDSVASRIDKTNCAQFPFANRETDLFTAQKPKDELRTRPKILKPPSRPAGPRKTAPLYGLRRVNTAFTFAPHTKAPPSPKISTLTHRKKSPLCLKINNLNLKMNLQRT